MNQQVPKPNPVSAAPVKGTPPMVGAQTANPSTTSREDTNSPPPEANSPLSPHTPITKTVVPDASPLPVPNVLTFPQATPPSVPFPSDLTEKRSLPTIPPDMQIPASGTKPPTTPEKNKDKTKSGGGKSTIDFSYPIPRRPDTTGNPPSAPLQPPTRKKNNLFIISFVLLLVTGGIIMVNRYIHPLDQFLVSLLPPEEGVIMEIRYRKSLWHGYGEVFEPIVSIPLLHADKGYHEQDFLLDSGALVSSLPSEKAQELGYSLAMLPRVTFAGFGGTTSFAYKTDVQIKVGDEEIKLPVVFTEAAGTKPIIGRSGFFEKYSVHFNSRSNKIEIYR